MSIDTSPDSFPAVSARFQQAVEVALKVVNSHFAPTNGDTTDIDEYPKILREILERYKSTPNDETIHLFKTGLIGSKIGIEIDGRRWNRFLKWFDKEMLPLLKDACQREKVRVLRPARWSGAGGCPENSESLIYVSFLRKEPPLNSNKQKPETSIDQAKPSLDVSNLSYTYSNYKDLLHKSWLTNFKAIDTPTPQCIHTKNVSTERSGFAADAHSSAIALALSARTPFRDNVSGAIYVIGLLAPMLMAGHAVYTSQTQAASTGIVSIIKELLQFAPTVLM